MLVFRMFTSQYTLFKEFVHEDSLHWPQAGEIYILFLHFILLHSDEQLHLINWRSDSGAGGMSVAPGNAS